MGTSVYVGILEDGSEVAVKKMLIETCEDAAENEKEILSLIEAKKSPYIVSYRLLLKDSIFFYLIADLCENTLNDHVSSQSIENLKEDGPRMVKEILTGLTFLHDQRILHRDLKPSNILVDVECHMRLADFGISRVLNEDETTLYTDAKGTQGWMSTEVLEAIDRACKCRYKKKSDVQVTGMITFFILTKGEHPFGASHQRMTNIKEGNPMNLEHLVDLCARKFVLSLISHDIKDRPYAHEALRHSFMDKIKLRDAISMPRIISWDSWLKLKECS
ncbi:serine threonine- kinase endoribonuclease ire-1-like [Paramuricea clavata]|uniref:Serine threonine- kinase endoribonuclease ire-1-like n=1 Tax=Paramuricea clavata TaxID=317549 RepID=A0A6S7IGY8_PARCT|nr:serine threonine- kinase endoribonuclease ire-1-like [Paramuricea clavata]